MKIAVPRAHTHAGVTYQAGMIVDLPEADIAWLMQAERTTREKLLAELPLPVVEIEVEPVEADAEETAQDEDAPE
ncbi:MAG: hypothetical protein ACYDCF_02915 [Burkholderiales bacterium]